ncbi:hypothetical protein I7I48_06013 [Histoplasma ohiense]|nr:hypothetical protein I7I48_06013 [Histoplasma ohiense (nom. inval.)]
MAMLTVSSRSPKTDALDRMTLSIKLKLYVTNSSGRMRRSILRTTSSASCSSELYLPPPRTAPRSRSEELSFAHAVGAESALALAMFC